METGEEREPAGRFAKINQCGEKYLHKPLDRLNPGIDAILDQLDNAAFGSSIPRFITQPSDDIVVVGTPAYYKKYENKVSKYGSVIAVEVDLINARLIGSEDRKATVIPALLEGDQLSPSLI